MAFKMIVSHATVAIETLTSLFSKDYEVKTNAVEDRSPEKKRTKQGRPILNKSCNTHKASNIPTNNSTEKRKL